MPALSRPARILPLAVADLGRLRARVRALAENRPAVYRFLDPTGRVLYVGKALRLRTRLLSYFRAAWPDDKASRILHAAHDIQWDYHPSEFAALLGELRAIRRFRPPFNDRLNRTRRAVLVSVAGGQAPRIVCGAVVPKGAARAWGPFRSLQRTALALRTLNDLLGLRDCALDMPIVWPGQGDLFDHPRDAGCMRHPLGLCTGPCAGLVSEREYAERVARAVAFLDGRALGPMQDAIGAMQAHAQEGDYERAARWKEKFEDLEWLLEGTTRARLAVEALTFTYRDPGVHGDDRAYVIRHGRVRLAFPWPATPIEREAFDAAVRTELETPAPEGPLPIDAIDEVLLLLSWFRRHPGALARTEALVPGA
ncbi:MAG: hypothetical protein NW201_05340 [Gemmatimonadales bacterium]|nr:hypothetical protein [Gemmatimonadales bacterium]